MSEGEGPLAAVLVDMDGTLVDTERLWLLAETDTMTALGSHWNADDQALCLGGPLERVSEYMVRRSGTTRTPEEVGALLLEFVEGHMRSGDVSFTPGTERLLDSLVAEGIPLALVSASHRTLVDVILARLGADHFTTTVAGDEVARSKPDPEPYLEAARRLGVSPERCAILEDSPTGVAAGLASGGLVVAIPHLVAIEPAPRLVVVTSLADVTADHLRAWVSESLA